MRLASKGLGRLTLPFDLAEADITIENDELWFRGRIKEKKVNWDYRMRLDEPDIVNFVRLARDPQIVAFLARKSGGKLLWLVYRRLWKTLLFFVGGRKNQAPPVCVPSTGSLPHRRQASVRPTDSRR